MSSSPSTISAAVVAATNQSLAAVYDNTTITVTTDSPHFDFRNIAESDYRSDLTIGLVSVLFVGIMIGIVFGNIIVIIAILTYRTLKNQQSNLFILNLAFADLGVVVTVMLWTTIAFILDMGKDMSNPWIFTDGMCYFQCAMNYCLIVVSMMTLGFISVDRLVHIAYPLRYHDIMSVKRIRIMICWTWIQGLIIGFIPVGMQWIHYDYCEVVCAIDWSSKHADKFVIVAFITCFIAPAVTMVICYSVIFRRSMAYTAEIRRSAKLVNSNTGSEKNKSGSMKNSTNSLNKKQNNNNKQERYGMLDSSTKTPSKPHEETKESNRIRRHNRTVKESTIIKSLLVVVLVFFICMTPFSVTKLIKVLKGYIPCWVNTLATLVQLSASACNPLIYGIFRKEYRKAFKIQYNKVCHRMAARFTSSDYSDSFNTPYYSDNKPPTFKRKEVSKKMSVSSVRSNSNNDCQSLPASQSGTMTRSTTLLYPHNESDEGLDASNNSRTALCSKYNQSLGPQATNGQTTSTDTPLSAIPLNVHKYSIPHRSVSFSDTPELVNPTTEIVAL